MLSLMFYLLIGFVINIITPSIQLDQTKSHSVTPKLHIHNLSPTPEISVAQLCEDMGINSNMLFSCYCVKGHGVVIYITCPNYQESIVILTDNIKKIQFAFGHLPHDKAKYKWISYNIKKLRDKMVAFECKDRSNIMRTEYIPSTEGILEVPLRQPDLCFKIIPKLPPSCLIHRTLNCLCITLMDSEQPCKCLYYSTQRGIRILAFKCKHAKHQTLIETIRSFYEKAASIETNSSTIRFYIQTPVSIASLKVCNDTNDVQTSYNELYLDIKLVSNATLCMTIAKTFTLNRRSVKQQIKENVKSPFGQQDFKSRDVRERLKRSQTIVGKINEVNRESHILETALFALGIGSGIQGVILILAAAYKYHKRP